MLHQLVLPLIALLLGLPDGPPDPQLLKAEALTNVIRSTHVVHEPPDADHKAWLDLFLHEALVQAEERHIDPLIPLTVAQHESHFRFWARSPSEEYCGMFQQAARYSLDPPLPPIGASATRCAGLGYTEGQCRKLNRRCRDVEVCRQECDRLTNPAEFQYIVETHFRYLEGIRARHGDILSNICHYQGGLYRPCGEHALGYQERHLGHRTVVERIWQRARLAVQL